MRVFISHSSKDKPAVEALAIALRERGIEPWLDKWEIGPGGDIVSSINEGLDTADAGIIVFSRHSKESRWVTAEADYLTYARIQEHKVLIPVVVGDDAWVPPLLRPLARRGIDETEALADALLGRKGGPPPVQAPERGRIQRVLITLLRAGPSGVDVTVRIGETVHAHELHASISRRLKNAHAEFLRGFPAGGRRESATAERGALDSRMIELGTMIGTLCFPGGAGDAVANLVDGCPIGTTTEVFVEAEGAELLGLPFEALLLPDNRLLAMRPSVVMLRRPLGVAAVPNDALAGPLKILVAVGAPDEGSTHSAVLDPERELQNILDAVEAARRHENAEVRILEVGNAAAIGAAVEADAYHVLHVSCHGNPGHLELEDEDGGAVTTTPDDLISALKTTGRPLPLVMLNACHGGVQDGQTASFAETLLRGGVPGVLAMQTSVSDHYATRLASAFYKHLSHREVLRPSHALAVARKELEQSRVAAVSRGEPLSETQPEYASVTLFIAGEERPLANFALDRVPLSVRPTYNEVAGPVPQLRLDDLIGRRRELRECLRSLRDDTRQYAGVVLTGIGGVGKSAIAGRAMQRLREDGYVIPSYAGRFRLAAVADALGVALLDSDRRVSRERGERLTQAKLEDRVRLALVAQALAEERVILVLDDFEQNLTTGGGAFLDPDFGEMLTHLADNARAGRLLITSRYPIPGTDSLFRRIAVGPLSLAETRKMILRLRALQGIDSASLARVLNVIGGHPRVLELLDALLRGGAGRLPSVTRKLRDLLARHRLDVGATSGQFDESLNAALALGARDVFLDELLDLARAEGIDEALLQAAVSNLPVSAAGLAQMLAGGEAPSDEETLADRTLSRLEDLALLHRFPNGDAWVHRWTAEGLARIDREAHGSRCIRAGRYRKWRVEHETKSISDAIEAVRNFLEGDDIDPATALALLCCDAFRRSGQLLSVAAVASEVLKDLPESHPNFSALADEEAQAHVALGDSGRALRRYLRLLAIHESRVREEPDRAVYQSDLSVSYEKLGDLFRDLGQGKHAREYFSNALAIRERLARAEPDRADYQRDLTVSYISLGSLFRSLGQGEQAREYLSKALAIRERLARAKPDRADYQRDLSVSYIRLGDLFRSLGKGEQAREHLSKALAIRERLARAEPGRADYQRDLSVSYSALGDLFRALEQGQQASEYYLKDLAIAERLTHAEPDRTDYQRHLSVSYHRLGDLFGSLGQGEQAREYFLSALAIRERLVRAEPERTDYQRGLSISYNKLGVLFRALGQGQQAREYFLKDLAIAERLARAEPDRADYQHDLSVSYNKLGDLFGALGQGEQAHEYFSNSLAIAERLARAEPDRADYQRHLSVTYNKLGDLFAAFGHGEQAREHFSNSLAIAERLARAEPDRADYQRDLIIALVQLSDANAPTPAPNLRRALSIATSLHAAGKLAPSDGGMIPTLNRLLQELGG